MPNSMLRRVARALSRVTSSGRMIGEIDGLRFIAIGVVIMHHVLFLTRDHVTNAAAGTGPRAALVAGWMHLADLGNVGVQLFFGISGFILALPFAEARLAGGRPVKLGKYYVRRLTRLEPPYIINLLLLCGLALLLHGADRFDRIPSLFASLTYTHNVLFGAWSNINFVAWSLEIEAQFYVAAPLLASVFFIRSNWLRRTVVVAGMLACAALATALSDASYAVRMLLPFHLQFFLVGFLLSDLYVTRQWKHAAEPARWADFFATVGILGVFLLWSLPSVRQLAFLSILLFYVCVLRSRVWKRVLNWRWIVLYGGMCYTVYLYHFWVMRPFVQVATRTFAVIPAEAAIVILTAGTFVLVGAVGAILFAVFEKPFMYPDWPKRLGAWLRRARRNPTALPDDAAVAAALAMPPLGRVPLDIGPDQEPASPTSKPASP